MEDEDFPDGLGHPHLAAPAPLVRHASPLSLLVLGSILAVALAGPLGGGAPPVLKAQAEGEAALDVTVPAVLRNGEFFEMNVVMTPGRHVDELTFAAEPSLWRDMTQNSMMPAAADESFSDGLFRFAYGPAEAGERVEIKMDFQINPALVGGTQGFVAVLDGDETLVRLPVAIEVRP